MLSDVLRDVPVVRGYRVRTRDLYMAIEVLNLAAHERGNTIWSSRVTGVVTEDGGETCTILTSTWGSYPFMETQLEDDIQQYLHGPPQSTEESEGE